MERLFTKRSISRIGLTLPRRVRIWLGEWALQWNDSRGGRWPSNAQRSCKRWSHAALRRPSSAQMSAKASTRCSMSASLWCGDGVIRNRSVPRGTVG